MTPQINDMIHSNGRDKPADITNLITALVMTLLKLDWPDDHYGNAVLMDACLRLAAGAAEQLPLNEEVFIQYARSMYQEIRTQGEPALLQRS